MSRYYSKSVSMQCRFSNQHAAGEQLILCRRLKGTWEIFDGGVEHFSRSVSRVRYHRASGYLMVSTEYEVYCFQMFSLKCDTLNLQLLFLHFKFLGVCYLKLYRICSAHFDVVLPFKVLLFLKVLWVIKMLQAFTFL